MKITINDHRKIFAIQEEFNTLFPYLKLEFLAKPSNSKGVSGHKYVKNESKTLGECRIIHKKGEIVITPQMTIIDLEERFKDIYGLGVHVLYKVGENWLEANSTKKTSLQEKNRQAELETIKN